MTYSIEDGIKSILSILLYHSKFQEFYFTGTILPCNKLNHYKESSCIITTSEDPAVAQIYGTNEKNNSANYSFFCTY
ncbi:unnamed protein product [Adineta steineri]|uniref:Uncharacterized protein n=1 Tax=Adineta steineri TaxID=433720 RepID=A0A819KZA0_9BILA|nr:unnamed protein product [Adineta steineri]